MSAAPQLNEAALDNPFLKVEDYDRILKEGFFWLANFNNDGTFKDIQNNGKIGPPVAEYTEKWWVELETPTFVDGVGIPLIDTLSVLPASTTAKGEKTMVLTCQRSIAK